MMNENQIKKCTVEEIAKELFSLSLNMTGTNRDQLDCILQTLVNIIRDKNEPKIR